MAINAPDAPAASERLTMTLSAIARADWVVLLITGQAKRLRFEASMTDVTSPIGALARVCGDRLETLWAA
jgi:6-phosphogluconolactonase/glucosamine-6-phosphate isomerase/deaminase